MKKSRLGLWLLLFLLALLILEPNRYGITLNIYQGRDIRRTAELIHGSRIWYGPDLSGGGHTPGPFYYYLLTAPYAIFGTWESLVWFELVLAAAAAAVLWFVGETLISSFAGFLLYFLFVDSNLIQTFLRTFWNPSFLYLFQAILLLLAPTITRDRKRLVVFSLLLGLSLQLHYTQLFFLAGAIGAIALAAHPRRRKLENIALFLAGVTIPLLPFLFWSLVAERTAAHSFSGALEALLRPEAFLANSSLDQAATRFLPNLKQLVSIEGFARVLALLWVLALGSRAGRKQAILRSPFLWIAFATSTTALLLASYELALTRYLSPLILFIYVLSLGPLAWLETRWRPAFLALFTVIGLSAAVRAPWRAGPPLPESAAFIVLALALFYPLSRAYALKPGQRRSLAILLIVGFLAFENSAARAHLAPGAEGVSALERDRFLREVVGKTGWEYEYFREHAFLVGFHPESEYDVLYKEAFRRPEKAPPHYDGIFAIRRSVASFLGPDSRPNWNSVRGEVPTQLFRAGLESRIRCDLSEKFEQFDLCFYNFNVPADHASWNDIGYSYQRTEPPFPKELGPGHWLLSSNPCVNLEPACAIYFEVKLLDGKRLQVSALGDPFGVPNPAPNPANVTLLRDVKLTVSCKNGSRDYDLASLIGIDVGRHGGVKSGFLAPYRNIFPAPCESPRSLAITARDGYSAFAYGSRFQSLSDFRLEWHAPN